MINIPKYRFSFVRFLAQNHKLPIVMGRWNNRQIGERLCPTCHIVGDEFHFVLICNVNNLSTLRKQYIDRYYITRPSMFKFIQLLNTSNAKTVQNLAIFIYKGLMQL